MPSWALALAIIWSALGNDHSAAREFDFTNAWNVVEPDPYIQNRQLRTRDEEELAVRPVSLAIRHNRVIAKGQSCRAIGPVRMTFPQNVEGKPRVYPNMVAFTGNNRDALIPSWPPPLVAFKNNALRFQNVLSYFCKPAVKLNICRDRLANILEGGLDREAKHVLFFVDLYGQYAGLNADPRPLGRGGEPIRVMSSIGTTLGVDSGETGKDGGDNRGKHRDDHKWYAPSGNPCLLVGSDGACVSGIRRTSRLYDAVCLLSALLLGIFAGISSALTFPVGKVPDYRWLAAASACAIGCLLFFEGGVTGKLWLFGL